MNNLLTLLLILNVFTITSSFAIDVELEDVNDLEILEEFSNDTTDEDAISEFDLDNEDITENDDDLEGFDEFDELDDVNLNDIGLEKATLENVNPFEEIELDSNTIMTNQDEDQEIDFRLIKEFEQYKKDNVQDILKQVQSKEDSKYTNFELEALKVQLKDILKSSLRLAHIAKGTKLTRVSDGQIVYTTKPITVRAYTLLDFNKDRYIINKKGELSYKVYYKKLSDIKKITNLYRKPHKFIRYKENKNIYNFVDKTFPLSFHMNLHTGLNSPSYTNDLVGSKSIAAVMLRTELTLLSQKDLIFNSGITLMYETMTAAFQDGGTYQVNSLSLGPSFKFNEIVGTTSLILQPRLSLFSQATIPTDEQGFDILTLSETSFLVGLETEKSYPTFGYLNLGINIQKKWINTSSQSSNYTISDSTNSDDSFSLYIGHRSDWLW
jgi:hypothetical protein